MLRNFVVNKHYKFAKSADDWKDAIRKSCESIEADGTVDESYKEEIIRCVEEYGPYIVIMPNVAMPHSQENSSGVNKTAIAFMKLEEPVSFEEGNPDLDAQLFFTLASCNHNEHLDNMTKLVELLSNPTVVEKLTEAVSPDDLMVIQETYLDN